MELEYYLEGYSKKEFEYRSYPIYMKPSDTYLLLYTIDENAHVVTVL